jgi:putative transposase
VITLPKERKYFIQWLPPKKKVKKCLSRMSGKLSRTVLRRGKGSNPFSLVEFTSQKYIDLLKANHIRISMDGRGRATDNARTERFFRSLKYEKLYIMEYYTVAEVKSAIASFVNEYNIERPHQAIGYRHPLDVYFNNECQNITEKEEFIHTKIS